MNLSNTRRTQLRRLQDRFLATRAVRRAIEEMGEDAPVFEGSRVTYADLRTTLYPVFESDLQALTRAYESGR